MHTKSHDTTPVPRPSFGQNLRRARHAANLTQADLAGRVGLDRAAIGLCEQDHRQPNLRTILNLARVLGVQAGELVRGL